MAARPTKNQPIKKGLGRGLDGLLGPSATRTALLGGDLSTADSGATLRTVPIERVTRGSFQPRRGVDEAALQGLADSIKSQGVMQPVTVKLAPGGDYEIITGERRWRAAQMAGLTQIPVLIRDLSERQAQAWALVENIQRQDLNAVEEAHALRHLVDRFKLTHEVLAQTIGRSRASITNSLRLLKLPQLVLEMIEDGAIEMGHARALLGAPAQAQARLAKRVERENLSVRQAERLAIAHKQGKIRRRKRPAFDDPDIVRLARHLSDQLGAEVQIKPFKGGSGRVVIQYGTLEELEGILHRLQRA